jgi:transposase
MPDAYEDEDTPWRDEELLRELHIGRGLNAPEIADRLDTDNDTILKWMERCGVEYDPNRGKPWCDEQRLRERYHGQGMRVEQIAEEFGCSGNTVRRWMDRLGVEKRDAVEERTRGLRLKPAKFETRRDGYERWKTEMDGEKHVMYVHRLLAVAEYGTDAVADMQVHHENGIPWDNRPENIELLSIEEHGQLHAEERWRF